MQPSSTLLRRSTLAIVLIVALLLPTAPVFADGTGPNPHIIPVLAPRTSPRPIPHTSVLKPSQIWNLVVSGNLPPQSSMAASVAKADGLSNGHPGILKKTTDIASGTTLSYHNAAKPSACLDFNAGGSWASRALEKKDRDVFTDWFGGWGAFAVDDGYRQAKNVVFSKENVVGPGENYNDSSAHAVKISSTQPYAAGFASPLFSANPGDEVKVVVRYLIYNHGNISPDSRWDYDWASLGVKADAFQDMAQYVNGYTRGQWAVMENTVTVGASGKFMVMIQGESPAALNSNIYFDDLEIYVNGKAMSSCIYE